MHSSYFNAKKAFEFSSARTSIARLRFISSVPAVLNLKFGTREAAAHFFFFFGSRRRKFHQEQNTIRLQAEAAAVVAFLNSTTNRCVLVLLS